MWLKLVSNTFWRKIKNANKNSTLKIEIVDLKKTYGQNWNPVVCMKKGAVTSQEKTNFKIGFDSLVLNETGKKNGARLTVDILHDD